MKLKKLALVIAVDDQNGIGKNGGLAWNIKEDMDFFRTLTSSTKKPHRKNAVVMGRKTWESIPEKFRPLPGRINCVLSSAYGKTPTEIGENSFGFADFEDCHIFLSHRVDVENIFIIGGSFLYNMMLDSPHLETLYVTRIHGDFGCDTFFSPIPETFLLSQEGEKKKQGDIEYQMLVYKAKDTGMHFLKNLKIPAIFQTKKFFFYLSAFCISLILIFFSFSFFTQEDTLTPLPKIETPIQENTVETPIQEEIGTTETPQETESSVEETIVVEEEIEPVSEPRFIKKEISENNILFFYPELSDSQKQQEISQYLEGKKLEFKITNFNERNTEKPLNWKIDYEENENEIIFSEYKNEEKIAERKISLQ